MAEKKETVEATVRTIRRVTREKYSAEEKVRIVLEALRGETSIAALCRREGSLRTCTIDGARTSSRRGSNAWWATPNHRPMASR